MKLLFRLKDLLSGYREKRGSRERLRRIYKKLALEHRREIGLAILEENRSKKGKGYGKQK